MCFQYHRFDLPRRGRGRRKKLPTRDSKKYTRNYVRTVAIFFIVDPNPDRDDLSRFGC